jgi:type VII secretion-associated serine protease mycosin
VHRIRPHLALLVAVAVAVAVGALLPSPAAAAAPTRLPVEKQPPAHAAHRLLVRFVADADPETVSRGHGFRAGKNVGRTGFTVVETGSVSAENARERLRGARGVLSVELDRQRRIAATPNDPAFTGGHQAALQQVGFPAAWDIAKAGSGQKIAVVDTGVDLDHPELDSRVLPGWDFVDNDAHPQDLNGHGTTVAGIAAAETHNNAGMAGASWGASIIPIRALDAEGEGFDSDIADAITWAVDHGATVVNLSLGGPDQSDVLEAAVADALARNVVVVAATGNDGTGSPSYPAAIAGTLAVGATDGNGNLAYFSQHGSWVDIAAPGTEVLGPTHEGATQYVFGTGTSFASPIVAGAVALVRTWRPGFTAAQVVDQLQATARDNGPVGKDTSYGWGILDASAAVGGTAAADIAPVRGDPHEPNGTSGTARVVTASTTGTIAPETDVDWYAIDVPAVGSLTVTVTPEVDLDSWQAMDPRIDVYSPAGARLGGADATGPDEAETATVVASAAGRYRVRVGNVNGARSPGSYAFAFSTSSAPPVTTTTTTTAPPTTTTTTTAPPTTTTTTTAPPPPSPPPARSGYWMVDGTGHVYPFGDARHHGALNGARGNVVDLEPTASGNGYWLLASAGEVFTYGDARHGGQPSGLAPGEVVTSMSAHPFGVGYWVFTSRGRAFAFGGAPHRGDMAGRPLNGPVLDSVATPSGQGYYMVASDGGIFAFGDAAFRGSMGGRPLNAPVQSLVPDGDNDGYWLVASDGGVFAFDAGFRGSMGGRPLNRPVTGMVRFGNGYLMVGEDGGIFNFSDKPFHGSLGSSPPAAPVVAVAAVD